MSSEEEKSKYILDIIDSLLKRDINCAICLLECETHTEKLPCEHVFHKECLANWKEACDKRDQLYNCPTCRKEIPSTKENIDYKSINHPFIRAYFLLGIILKDLKPKGFDYEKEMDKLAEGRTLQGISLQLPKFKDVKK